ncbi:MAG TPA: AAA family ATPase [Candidatus Limnocylindrales bacterium]|nr:AAA family ATPase [Candidatus Limnocylindrales bacterium]
MDEPRRIPVPDPSLVVLAGAAGSGKTTFARRHFAPDEVLSSDAYRGLVAGDPFDQAATAPAFAALHRELARRLQTGRLTVVDATNVSPRARRALLARAADARVPAIAIVLDLPREVVLARNAARPGRAAVPEDAVRAQLDALAATLRPDASGRHAGLAGFDAVHVLATPAGVDRAEVVRMPRDR